MDDLFGFSFLFSLFTARCLPSLLCFIAISRPLRNVSYSSVPLLFLWDNAHDSASWEFSASFFDVSLFVCGTCFACIHAYMTFCKLIPHSSDLAVPILATRAYIVFFPLVLFCTPRSSSCSSHYLLSASLNTGLSRCPPSPYTILQGTLPSVYPHLFFTCDFIPPPFYLSFLLSWVVSTFLRLYYSQPYYHFSHFQPTLFSPTHTYTRSVCKTPNFSCCS